eukprot:67935_1
MSFNLQRVLETGDDVHITNRVFNWNWKERCDRWYSEIGIKIGMISNESCDGDKETNEWKGSKLEEEPTESCDVIYAYCCRCCGGETEIQSNVIDARFRCKYCLAPAAVNEIMGCTDQEFIEIWYGDKETNEHTEIPINENEDQGTGDQTSVQSQYNGKLQEIFRAFSVQIDQEWAQLSVKQRRGKIMQLQENIEKLIDDILN